MKRRVASIVLVAALAALTTPLVLYLLGRDRYPFSYVAMPPPKDVPVTIHSAPGAECSALAGEAQGAFLVECDGYRVGLEL